MRRASVHFVGPLSTSVHSLSTSLETPRRGLLPFVYKEVGLYFLYSVHFVHFLGNQEPSQEELSIPDLYSVHKRDAYKGVYRSPEKWTKWTEPEKSAPVLGSEPISRVDKRWTEVDRAPPKVDRTGWGGILMTAAPTWLCCRQPAVRQLPMLVMPVQTLLLRL